MAEDARLSEFLSNDETDGSKDGGSGAADAIDSTDSGAVEPAVSTYAWGEYICDRCDERTARVWRDEDALVCPDCKSW